MRTRLAALACLSLAGLASTCLAEDPVKPVQPTQDVRVLQELRRLLAEESLQRAAGSSDDERQRQRWRVQLRAKPVYDRLIKQLGSDRFVERDAADKLLATYGRPALDDLRYAAANDRDPEVRRRASMLVERLAPPARHRILDALPGTSDRAFRMERFLERKRQQEKRVTPFGIRDS